MLTRRQHLLLSYLRDRTRRCGATPSFSEMAEAIGLRSKGSVHRLVGALEERGYIRRLARRARAIEVIDAPRDAAATLIAEVLDSGAADLIEKTRPGWRGRAQALLGEKQRLRRSRLPWSRSA